LGAGAVKIYFFLLLLIFAPSLVSAYNMTFYVFDINTRVPLEAVEIYLGNETDLTTNTTTNAAGLAVHSFDNLPYYWFSAKTFKIGYGEKVVNFNISANSDSSLPLIPISNNGIVTIVFNDMTLKDHEICIYYEDNGRLDGCYLANETATLLVNKNYLIRPRGGFIDQVSTLKGAYGWGVFVLGTVLGGIVLFILIYFAIYYLWGAFRRK